MKQKWLFPYRLASVVLVFVCGTYAAGGLEAADIQSAPVLFHHESADEPRLSRLINEFEFDAYIASGVTEFEQMALLKDWVYGQIPYELNYNDSELRDAIQILSRAGRGDSFLCSNKATVYMQCAVSKGWTSRYILLKKPARDEHAGNDIWSNMHRKWIYMDPTWNIHIEKNYIPLSIGEIRMEWLKNKGRQLMFVFGAGANEKRYRYKDLPIKRGDSKIWKYIPIDREWLSYTHEITVLGRNDFFSCCNGKVWKSWEPLYAIQGKPGFKARIRAFLKNEKQSGQKALFHDLNRVDIKILQNKGKRKLFHPGNAEVTLNAFGKNNFTPNFMEFLVKINNADWKVMDESFKINLAPGATIVRARIMNRFGVAGPISMKVVKVDK